MRELRHSLQWQRGSVSLHAGAWLLHAFFVACLTLAAAVASAQSTTWTVTTESPTQRADHTATLLGNGKVLIAGGGASWTELYEPASASWSDTSNYPRTALYQTANLLANGKVLLAAGSGASPAVNTADLYDPTTNTWSNTGDLTQPRYWHSSVRLANGKILVMGGKSDASTFLTSTEIYDPATGTWSTTGNMLTPRALFPAVLLASGKVLVAGGYTTGPNNTVKTANAELYDPATGSWAAAGPLGDVRAEGLMQRLNDGRILLAGGKDPGNCTNRVELYNPASNTWSPGPSMHYARGGHFTLTLMPDGQALAVGGVAPSGYWNSTELYDPLQNAWKYAGRLAVDHVSHAAVLLPNGQLLVVGGYGTYLVELYGPAMPRTRTDFGGDGKSDIVFANGANANWLYNMNGVSVQSAVPLPGAASGWVLAGMGDFDGNHSVDLLWRNVANPTLHWIYLVAGNSVIGGGALIVGSGYRATFIADFNGDGKADILWENGGPGRWLYFMNGAAVSSTKPLPAAAPGYAIVAVGDFNGDHHADVLWLNTAAPTQYWMYLMQSGNVIGGGGLAAALGYIPTRVADFNGDGTDDLLWENRFGSRWLYFMSGAAVSGSAPVPPAAPGWNIVGAADFDNNHSADLVWQNSTDPTHFWIYLMSSGVVTAGGGLTVAEGYAPLTR